MADAFSSWQGNIDESFSARFSGMPAASNAGKQVSDPWRPLPDVSKMDFGYLNNTADTISPGQSKANGWLNWGASQITGLPSGNTGGVGPNPGAGVSPAGAALTSIDFAQYFVRAVVVILGFIFVAMGLYMFAPTSTIVTQAIKKMPGR